MKHSKKITLKRWLDVILLGIVSYVTILMLCKIDYLNNLLFKWAMLVNSFNTPIQLVLFCIGIYGAYSLCLSTKTFRLSHLINTPTQLRYPSTLVSVVICLYLLSQKNDISIDNEFDFIKNYLIIAFLVFFFMMLLLLQSNEYKNSPSKKTKEQPSYDDFLYWLDNEQPISTSSHDQFDRKIYSKRLASLLLEENKAHHIALVGKFGSGKSSITSITEELVLQKNNDFIFLPIDGWGIPENSISVIILDEIIERIFLEVDCTSIKNVPNEYLKSMSGSDLFGSNIIEKLISFTPHRNPIDAINKINEILISINKKIVIILDNFDRNNDSKKISNELSSLLENLRKLTNINFILSIDYGENSELITKITTHREDLSSIDCTLFIDQFLLSMKNIEKENTGFISNAIVQSDDYYEVKNILNNSIETPRQLKNIMRRVRLVWKTLAGEVNLYDLIILFSLRSIYPKTFDLIIVKSSLEVTSDNEKTQRMINYLKNDKKETAHEHRKLKGQRIAHKGASSYLKKCLEEDCGNFSDLKALKEIQSVKIDNYRENKAIKNIHKSDFLFEKLIQYSDIKFNIQDRLMYGILYESLLNLINTNYDARYKLIAIAIKKRPLNKKEFYFFIKNSNFNINYLVRLIEIFSENTETICDEETNKKYTSEYLKFLNKRITTFDKFMIYFSESNTNSIEYLHKLARSNNDYYFITMLISEQGLKTDKAKKFLKSILNSELTTHITNPNEYHFTNYTFWQTHKNLLADHGLWDEVYEKCKPTE